MTYISFEEIKKRLETTYLETKEKLKSYVQTEKNENEEFQGKYDIEMFFRIFENFRDASQNEIEALIQENTNLKNDLKSTYAMVNLYIEKSEEIMEINNEHYYNNCSKFRIDNEPYDRNKENTYKTELLLENLNNIRDMVFDAFSKLKIKGEHIEILKSKVNQGSLLKSLISKKNFIFKHSYFDLLPKWMPDDVINKCMGCDKKFGVTRWKHHCRVCGGIFCSPCSDFFGSFLPFYVDEVRICQKCFVDKKHKNANFEINQSNENTPVKTV